MRYGYEECAYGEVDSLPGCSQIAVSHGVFVPKALRHQGRGKVANEKRLVTFKQELGYDYVLCSVSEHNVAEIHILEQNGWSKLDEFLSSKTDHKVYLYGRRL